MQGPSLPPSQILVFLAVVIGVVVWIVALLMMWHATKGFLELLEYVLKLAQI